MDLSLPLQHWEMFLHGVWVSVTLTVLSVVAGFALALPRALSQQRRSRFAFIPRGYAYFFRGTPLLVQTFLIYYGLGQFEFVRESWAWVFLKEAWWCALIAFSLNSGAYQTEILRGAFAMTPRGELEGAKALGMSERQSTWLVLIPSALRRAMPQYGNEVVFQLHSSVVASVITIQDILGAGRTLNARYYVAYEGFVTAAILYMALTFLLVGIFRLLERRYLRHLLPPEELRKLQKGGPGGAAFGAARV